MEAADADEKTQRRVRFCGSLYIEYDAEQAPVVRLGGAGRRLHMTDSSEASTASDAELLASLRLECEARGIITECDDALALQQTLRREYVKELRSSLYERGFVKMAALPVDDDRDGSDEDIKTLERQLQVAELLLTQVALLSDAESLSKGGSGNSAGGDEDTMELSAQVLARLQLAKKELEGQADEGYVFGRRFYSIEAYINSLEYEELVEIAQNRALPIPDIPEVEKKEITVVERELCAKHSTTGLGKPLKQLTLRELMVEAHARDLIVVSSRDKNGKRSKKGLIEKLRPVMRQEVLEEKILDKRDDLLRLLLLDVLEKEAAQDRTNALLLLIQKHLKRLEHDQSKTVDTESQPEKTSDPEAMDVEESSEPVADPDSRDASIGDASDQLQHYFSLLTRLQPPTAHQES